MRINTSEIKCLDVCAQLHHYLWIDCIKPVAPDSEALTLGKATHSAIEARLLNKGIPTLATFLPTPFECSPAKLEALELTLVEFDRRPHPWTEVIAVEQIVDRTLGTGDTIFGKIDLLARWQGRLWLVEHKTLGGYRSPTQLANYVRTSLQAGIYTWLAEKLEPIAGLMLNIVRKVSLKAAKESPSSALHVEFLTIGPDLVDHALLDVQDAISRRRSAERPYRNRESCRNTFGNGMCGFYGVCWGRETLDSPAFTPYDPLAHYTEEAE